MEKPHLILPPVEFRDKPIPMPITKKSVKQMVQDYEENITRKPIPPPRRKYVKQYQFLPFPVPRTKKLVKPVHYLEPL